MVVVPAPLLMKAARVDRYGRIVTVVPSEGSASMRTGGIGCQDMIGSWLAVFTPASVAWTVTCEVRCLFLVGCPANQAVLAVDGHPVGGSEQLVGDAGGRAATAPGRYRGSPRRRRVTGVKSSCGGVVSTVIERRRRGHARQVRRWCSDRRHRQSGFPALRGGYRINAVGQGCRAVGRDVHGSSGGRGLPDQRVVGKQLNIGVEQTPSTSNVKVLPSVLLRFVNCRCRCCRCRKPERQFDAAWRCGSM